MARKPAGKPSLTILETKLSIDELASALRLTKGEVADKFTDARVTSWFAEIWGERLFEYKKHIDSNHPGSDAALAIGKLGKFDISVRCLTKAGVKFQKSKDIGSRRGTTKDGVVEALEGVECVVVVDIRSFPVLRFVPIDSKHLIRFARAEGKTGFGTNGLTPKRFEAWIAQTFDVIVTPFELPEGSALEDAG